MQNRVSQGGGIPWFAVILALVIFWPVGLFLLIRKINTDSTSFSAQESVGMYADQEMPQGDEKDSPGRRFSTVSRGNVVKKRHRWMTVAGAILTGIGCIAALSQFNEMMYWFGTEWFFEELWNFLSICFIFFGSGIPLLSASAFLSRRQSRCNRYFAYMQGLQLVSIDEMAASVGVSSNRVEKDLLWLLDQGGLPGAYLDHATRELVFPGGRKKKKTVKKEPDQPPASQNEYEKIIQEIVRLNQEIDDEEVSRKIDRIESVTRRIFQQVQERPEKMQQLTKFMNYYLPNTLKILRAYAQFEEQGVEGDNIASAMQDIEEIMDKLVAGFEKQLDQLFESDAVDISTDITVLEGMLEKDGFGDDDFTLKL